MLESSTYPLMLLMPGLTNAPNSHPLFVHAPIVLIPLAAAVWGVALARADDSLFKVGRWLLGLGALGAIAAVASGFLAANAMGHDAPGHGLVHGHRNWMLVATALTVIVSAASFTVSTARARTYLLVGLLAAATTTVLGADRGALLVFTYSVGTSGEEPPEAGDHDHSAPPVSSDRPSEEGHGGHAH